jgi:hypothetical protein
MPFWSRASRRARIIWLGALVVLAGGIAALATLSSAGPSHSSDAVVLTSPAAPPGVQAQAACKNMDSVQRLIRADAPASQVFSYLSTATTQVGAAATGDPVWLSLQSGIQSIGTGLRSDDSRASTLGIAIVRDQCRRAGVTLAHFPPPTPGEPTS